jgi:hypothetical protein
MACAEGSDRVTGERYYRNLEQVRREAQSIPEREAQLAKLKGAMVQTSPLARSPRR